MVPPQVSVAASYPGASASAVVAAVAQPLEAAVSGLDRMTYMRSTCSDDGAYSLEVGFETGTDPDVAAEEIGNRLQTAFARLPEEVQHNGVVIRKRATAVL